MKLKKKLVALCLAVSMLASLCGCSPLWLHFPDFDTGIFDLSSDTDENYRSEAVSFSEMEYVRPDVDKMQSVADEITEMVSGIPKLKGLFDKLNEFYMLYFDFTTMEALAGIRSDIDVTDEYYAEEYDYCMSVQPRVNRITDDMQCACANSILCGYLDRRYFGGMLSADYSVDGNFSYSDELVELYNKENSLLSSYRAVLAEMLSYDGDDIYEKYNERACNIYIDLIKTRKEIADELGFDSYEDYMSMSYDREYSDDEISQYLDAIKEYIVPLYESAFDSGIMNDMYDGLEELSTEQAVSCFDSFISGMPEQIIEVRDFMKQFDLYNISSEDYTSDSSYTTYLDKYETPFMLIKTEGYAEDMLTVVHEFGHFCDEYVNYDGDANLDTMEVLSQSLEYLLLCYLDDANLADSLTRYKMLDELYLYVNQASFYDFEHRVFALSDDELTVDNVNSIFGEVAREYGYYDDGSTEVSWIDISHLFEYPFYVLSYCVSDSAAFSIYNMELEETGKGVDMYLKLLNGAADYNFAELLENEGMQSPVTEDMICEIAQMLQERLGV